ncbi:MAG: hypothetical protein U9Q98_10800 [Bacteroidota bacterium]|nr:hypothetical protein [Bacteroidota bacterium]
MTSKERMRHNSNHNQYKLFFIRAAGAMLLISGMVSASGLNLPLGLPAVVIRPDRISLPINLPCGQTAQHLQWQDTGLRQAASEE